jgi:hypothetical protein
MESFSSRVLSSYYRVVVKVTVKTIMHSIDIVAFISAYNTTFVLLLYSTSASSCHHKMCAIRSSCHNLCCHVTCKLRVFLSRQTSLSRSTRSKPFFLMKGFVLLSIKGNVKLVLLVVHTGVCAM